MLFRDNFQNADNLRTKIKCLIKIYDNIEQKWSYKIHSGVYNLEIEEWMKSYDIDIFIKYF